jgi:glyoxylase-like metal-dependent hydrolase (beta-lactamase superfamily II)
VEILPDVVIWQWYSDRHGYHFNGYLVRHPDGNVCLDPAEMSEETFAEITRLGVSYIVITNRNHVRASDRLHKTTGALLFIHPADAPYAEEQGATIDEYLEVGQLIGPLVVHPAQGKSAGEVALHWPERKILFVGDACIGSPAGTCSLLPEKLMEDPVALKRSLAHLASKVDFDALLMGDGAPIVSGGRLALQALVDTFH